MSTTSTDPPPQALAVTLTTAQLADLVRAAVADALAEHAEGASSTEALIDQNDCAKRLGVSLPTLRKMNLPSVRVGDHRRFLWRDVLAELQRRSTSDAGDGEGGAR